MSLHPNGTLRCDERRVGCLDYCSDSAGTAIRVSTLAEAIAFLNASLWLWSPDGRIVCPTCHQAKLREEP